MSRLSGNALLLFILSLWAMHPHAQSTGSWIESSNPENTTIWINQPREIDDIKRLIQDGKGEKAVEMAYKYVDSLKNQKFGEGQEQHYFALNALCAALTNTGELSEAIAICTEAADLIPSKWQAYNNRGTAYFVSRDYEKALQDYKHAMSIQNGLGSSTEIIQGNIRLAESRLAAN
jgi:tetratricopeptide (TPR) repeat protein